MIVRRLAPFVILSSLILAACSSGSPSSFTPRTDVRAQSGAADSAHETVLHRFTGSKKDGAAPISGLVKLGTRFYGTSGGGGSHGKGTVFSIAPNGTGFSVVYSFKGGQDGSGSDAGLTVIGNTLYGITASGGASGKGTVFSVTPAGAFSTLYSFKGGNADGAQPLAALTNLRGTLYGTTSSGGSANNGTAACTNCGTIFSITTAGKEKTLYFFGAKANDGIMPDSHLVFVGGTFYGTTASGGPGSVTGNGTIFSVTPSGKEAVVYALKDADGSCTFGCTLAKLGGTLYGTATLGGKNRVGSIFSITTGGAFTTLYSASTKDKNGGVPVGALTDANGLLYGTMSAGSPGGNGTVFSMTTAGKVTTIYMFAGGSDGAKPQSRLTLLGNALYGTTAQGGGDNAGTVYSISGF